MNITDEMVDLAVKVYRPADRGDRRTTREAMRDALTAVFLVPDADIQRGEELADEHGWP